MVKQEAASSSNFTLEFKSKTEMKKQLRITLGLGLLTVGFVILSSFRSASGDPNHAELLPTNDKLKKDALEILDTKCNVCHRKKNPFMVFNQKNMSKRAKKIYKMVFIERKMPKGNEVRLTNDEYIKLEKWLFTQNIF